MAKLNSITARWCVVSELDRSTLCTLSCCLPYTYQQEMLGVTLQWTYVPSGSEGNGNVLVPICWIELSHEARQAGA